MAQDAREAECARQWRGLRGWNAYKYACACTPCTQDLLPSSSQMGTAMGITELAHAAQAWLQGYLPDTHAEGSLTPGKPHLIAHVLEAAKASLQLW